EHAHPELRRGFDVLWQPEVQIREPGGFGTAGVGLFGGDVCYRLRAAVQVQGSGGADGGFLLWGRGLRVFTEDEEAGTGDGVRSWSGGVSQGGSDDWKEFDALGGHRAAVRQPADQHAESLLQGEMAGYSNIGVPLSSGASR